MRLIDTHCHIDVAEFESDRQDVLSCAYQKGVSAVVVPAVSASGFSNLSAICQQDERLFPAFGLHPVYLHQHGDADVKRLEDWIADHNPIAVGEIGLDYFIEEPERERQCELLQKQLAIAEAAGLPVLLHIRKAHDQVLAMLRRTRFRQGGIAHAFNGSRQQAEQFIALGFKLGFGGVASFERARKIRKLARELPLESIVLETDAPDLPPASRYGQRNSPEYLPEILQVIAQLRDLPPEVVAEHTTRNAIEVMPGLHRALE